MDPGTMGTAMGMWLLFCSAVHDHMYSKGERKATFFKWTGTNFSPMLNMAETIRKSEAKTRGRR